jgi:23S rRNA (adenine2503-C2)-methyltransferase
VPAPDPNRNLHGAGPAALTALLAELGAEPYRARQLFRAIHGEGARSFEEITVLPGALRRELAERFAIDRPEPRSRVESSDGTIKYLLDLPGGSRVEAVAIPDRKRWTLCLSSQVGCALGCTFCMTARMGLERQLAPGEIVGQMEVLAAELGLEPRSTRIVLMGMGEPLHNYDAVLQAVRILCDPEGAGLSPRRITLSTVGLAPEILRLAEEANPPRLAISLNATTDELRKELMPVARRYSLAELMEAAARFAAGHRDRVTFEYVLLGGVNDADTDARRLVRLVHGVRAKVNLIPFNPTPPLPYRRPPAERVLGFRDLLLARGVPASVRRSRGRDVGGACGQLAFSDRATAPGTEDSP